MKKLYEDLINGIETKSENETIHIGELLAKEFKENQILALYGDLGVGKTTFVKGIAKGLGIKDNITSPTYNIYNIYQGIMQLIHLDAYRLNLENSQRNLMLEDVLIEPYCLAIEWPINIPEYISQNTIKIELSLNIESSTHNIRLIS